VVRTLQSCFEQRSRFLLRRKYSVVIRYIVRRHSVKQNFPQPPSPNTKSETLTDQDVMPCGILFTSSGRNILDLHGETNKCHNSAPSTEQSNSVNSYNKFLNLG